jgi:hypothetical protein
VLAVVAAAAASVVPGSWRPVSQYCRRSMQNESTKNNAERFRCASFPLGAKGIEESIR